MRGLWIEDGHLTLRDDLAEPEAAAGETRLEILRAGICATDLALLEGYMGFRGVPGHEFVGRALDGPLAGKRVVGEINAACGACEWCRRGLGRHCPQRTVLGILGRDGVFAEQAVLPTANLHVVPDGVPTDAAVFTEPLAAAFEIAEQVPLRRGMRALVAGDGRLGLLCAMVLRRHGLEVTVAGRHSERRELLPDGVGFEVGMLEGTAPPPAAGGFDLAVEATGWPGVLERLVSLVVARGTIVLKTTAAERATIDLAPVVVHEITLVGSRCGPFEPALEALAAGRIRLDGLVHGRYALEDGVAALARAAEPGVLKILLDPAGEGTP